MSKLGVHPHFDHKKSAPHPDQTEVYPTLIRIIVYLTLTLTTIRAYPNHDQKGVYPTMTRLKCTSP